MDIKTKNEIEIMRQGGALLSDTLKKVIDAARHGVSMDELDRHAEKLLRGGGGEPSFKGYCGRRGDNPFPSTLCISVNEEVVHGLGCRKNIINEGDVMGLDIGAKFKGFFTDMAATVLVGDVSKEKIQLVNVTKESLLRGLSVVKDGAAVSDIGRAIEQYVKKFDYGIVRDLTGHGVGRKIHEDPAIPNYYDKRYDAFILRSGMTIAIEPMLTLGDWRIKTLEDGWTIVTADGSAAAHFEATIVVTDDGYEILTPL